ncbi:MAG: hypothetical protein ABIH23_09025, partial [bacterium]
PPEISVDQMVTELTSAGWSSRGCKIWMSPQGPLYLGPYGAWKVMMREKDLAALAAPPEAHP